MNTNLIPAVKKLDVSDKSVLLSEFSLSKDYKDFVKKASDIIPFEGKKEIILKKCEALKEDSYKIDINEDEITVTAPTPASAYYALCTIKQLADLNDGNIPVASIEDYPDFKLRGLSDDISRGQISNNQDFKDIIRKLSEIKCNLYMPYMEDVFKFDAFPDAGKYSDALSKDEWREIVEYARDYYVTIVPIYNIMGHWNKNAKLEYFQKYMIRKGDKPDGAVCGALDVRKPETTKLICDMLDELIEVFGESGAINVGGDEVGDYTNEQIFTKKEGGDLYNAHFKAIHEHLTKRGIKMWMYSDMYTPVYGDYQIGLDRIDEMPDDITYVYWDYGTRIEYQNIFDLSNRKPHYAVSPGTQTWSRFSPHHETAYMTAQREARDATKYPDKKAEAYVMSAWCDGGMNLREENWAGIHHGAMFAWKADDQRTFDEAMADYFEIFFGIKGLDMAKYHDMMDFDKCFTDLVYDPDKFEGEIAFWYYEHQLAGSKLYNSFWDDATAPIDKELKGLLKGAKERFERGLEYFSSLAPTKHEVAYKAFLFDIKRNLMAARKIELLNEDIYETREQAMADIPKIESFKNEVIDLMEENKERWFATNRESEWSYLEARYLDLIASFDSLCRYLKNTKRFTATNKL